MPHASYTTSKLPGTSRKRRKVSKLSKDDVKKIVDMRLDQTLESKFRMTSYSQLSGWSTTDHGVYADLTPDFPAGTGVSEVVGQDIKLLALKVNVMYTPGIVEKSINYSGLTFAENPYASRRPVRWAVIAMERSVALGIGPNFLKAMFAKWTPTGAFADDFVSKDTRQSFLDGIHILKKGSFVPQYENVICPDSATMSSCRTISIPKCKNLQIHVNINRKLRLTDATPKNFQRWVYAIYFSTEDANSATGSYNPFTTPKSIYCRQNFIYQDA